MAYATRRVELGTSTSVLGNVGTLEAVAPPDDAIELGLQPHVAILSGDLFADTVELKNGSSAGRLWTNELLNNGGTYVELLELPLLPPLPDSPPVVPGTTDVTVKAEDAATLAPGAYRDVSIGKTGRLTLSAGSYAFRSLSLKNDARFEAAGMVEVSILTTLDAGSGALLGPVEGSAAGLVLEVAGTDEDSMPGGSSVRIGTNASVRALLLASNASVRLDPNATWQGALAARYVSTAQGVELELESGIVGPPLCVPELCVGGNPCVVGSCCGGSCLNVPAPAGTPCSDSNPCNGDETCDGASVCQPGVAPKIDDGNPCTADSCDVTAGVQHEPLPADTSCSDGNACNGEELCDGAGTCQVGTPPETDDGNPCTTDRCEPAIGPVHEDLPQGTSCGDGNACNGDETCSAQAVCEPGDPPVVDDANPCTTDTCDPPTGVHHDPVASGTSCADQDLCNGNETCDGSGTCQPGPAPIVDDQNPCTADSCEPSSGPVHTPLPDASDCGDGNVCNGVELCDASAHCLPGEALDTDDGNPCTADSCDPTSGPVHADLPEGTSCSDGNPCNGAELCSAAAQCEPGPAPELLTVTSPASGTWIQTASVDITGTTSGTAEITVTVEGTGVSAVFPASTVPEPFTLTTVPLVEGKNVLLVRAVDANSCSGAVELLLVRDSFPPLVTLEVPESVSETALSEATASVTDDGAVVEITVSVTWLGEQVFSQTFTEPPYTLAFSAPVGAQVGDTLEVTVRAVDRAGNIGEDTRTVIVSADGMIVGRVLSDTTGRPLDGATVELDDETTLTRSDGRFRLAASGDEAVLTIRREGHSPVDRIVSVVRGVGSVALDARLTPLEPVVVVGTESRTLEATLGTWSTPPVTGSLAIPEGALPAEATLSWTPLSPQGLPGLLPRGWSPVAAFDLDAGPDVLIQEPLTLSVEGVGEGPVELALYDADAHAWRSVATGLLPTGGQVNASINELGGYALVRADAPGAPASGEVGTLLPGVPVPEAPLFTTAAGVGEPSLLPPSGGNVVGRVLLPSATALASGAVLQVALSEAYDLSSGEVASTETWLEDLVLYQGSAPSIEGVDTSTAAALLGASFPILPSQSYALAELVQGGVHVDILAGREATRGQIGGHGALLLEQGALALSVPAGALSETTVVNFEEAQVGGFLPESDVASPIQQLLVDLSGASLTAPARVGFQGTPAGEGETLLLARIERDEQSIARPAVVALGTSDGDDGATAFEAGAGFPGVNKEGSYVIYRVTGELGFLEGTTRTAGAPVQAMVSAESLPFVALSAVDGSYRLPALAGDEVVKARVAGTNLVAHATASVQAGLGTSLDLDLVGEVTTADVTPRNGAVAVEWTAQVELSTPVALDAETVTAENVKLLSGPGEPAQEVAVRLVLSTGKTLLALVPEARLEPDTSYTLQASGLRDELGGLVVVPTTTFRTKADVPPVHDTNGITFSMPDENGLVVMQSGAGSLPPGTTVLVTNEGNGYVVSYTVDNDGALVGEVPASIDDKLLVTVTDPFGNSTTFVRSQFVGSDGRTAVGPGGGVVSGPGGVEIRVPEGALSRGTIFTVIAQGPEAFPERPDMPAGHFGGVLKVDAEGQLAFRSEVDLAFPKPADAPDGAFYYVYRRLVAPEGQTLPGGAAFEVIDHAFVEGAGAGAKVVTASCPFPGFLDIARVLGPSLTEVYPAAGSAVFVLLWTFESALPAVPAMGIIRGRVLRTVWDDGAQAPRYEGIVGAVVSGRDANGQAFPDTPMTVAVTQRDGTYTLWDKFPTEGRVLIAATDGTAGTGQTPPHENCPSEPSPTDHVRCVTPVQEVVAGCADNARYYRNQVKADITFPPKPDQDTPEPPDVDIRVLREVDGQRRLTDGLVVVAQPLLIGFSAENADVRTVEVAHAGATDSLALRDDPRAGQADAVDKIADFTPVGTGTYVVTATALPVPYGAPIAASVTFRSVASGGELKEPVVGEAPAVLTGLTSPRDEEVDVPTTVFPFVAFSEPVRNVPGHVLLQAASGEDVDITLVGTTREGNPVELAEEDDALPVTAVTIQPRSRLKFGIEYTLTLTEGIEDLDDEDGSSASLPLPEYSTTFTTLDGPQALANPEAGFPSSGIATAGHFAFVVENNFTQGILRVFDISNPASPQETWDAQKSMAGRPMDIAARSEADGGATVVVITGPTNVSLPSNARIYRVSNTGATEWVGAASLTTTATQGIAQRVTLYGDLAYTTTTFQGIQAVDLPYARQIFEDRGGDTSRIRIPLNSDGQGFGQEAVVLTVPVLKSNGRPAFLSDIAVTELLDGYVQPIVIAAGDVGLAIVNPQSGEVLFPVFEPVPGPEWERPGFIGRALTVVKSGSQTYVALAGEDGAGGTPTLLMVDVTDPRAPRIMGGTELPQRPLDVTSADGLVLVGGQGAELSESTTAIVNVDDLDDPFVAGTIAGLAGRLAVAEDGLLLSTMPSTTGEESVPLGGVHTATLGAREQAAIRISLEGGRTSIAAGESARAIAHTRPEGKAVDWKLRVDREDEGVKAEIDAETGQITVHEQSTDGFATIRASLRDDPNVVAEAKVRIGCECESCRTPGNCEKELEGLDVVWSVGAGSRGESGGNVFLRTSNPTGTIYTPGALLFSSLDLTVEPIYGNDKALRQVVAPQTLLDVVTLGSQSFELRFYDASAKGERQPEGHFQVLPGSVASVVWRIENPSSTATGRLRMTETRGADMKHHEYEWDLAQGRWVLRQANGENVEERIELVSSPDRVVRIVRRDANGVPSSVVELTYHRYSWGEEVIREVTDPDGAALTTATDYWDTQNEAWHDHKVRSVLNPDGSWVRYDYHRGATPTDLTEPGWGKVETEIHSWLDAPPTAAPSEARVRRYRYSPVDSRDSLTGLADPERSQPRTVIEEIRGIEVSRTYFAYVRDAAFGPRETVEERCTRQGCSYGAPDNLRTVTTYYGSNDGLASDGRVWTVRHPDGKLDTYRYEYDTYQRPSALGGGFGTAVRQTVVHGTIQAPAGIAGKTTREVSVTDERGQPISDERSVFTGAGYALLDWTRYSYDGQGRLLQEQKSNGELETNTWGCCSELSSTDSRGITTTVLSKDALERPLQTHTAGVTTTVQYDAEGRVLATTRSGGGLSVTSHQRYDLAGRLVESADEQGLVTRRTHDFGGRVTSLEYPGGFTEVTEQYADGQPKSTTGTAVVAQYFAHVVNLDGTRVTEVRQGSPSSPVYQRTITDVAGRAVRIERPGFDGTVEATETVYNALGQVVRTSTTGIADTLHEYDALGEPIRTGLDVDGNGVLDLAGDDRVTETETSVVSDNGAWWQQTLQRAYPTRGSDASVVTSTKLSRLSGFGAGVVSEQVSRDIYGNTTRATVSVDRATRTETQRADTPGSTQDAVEVGVDGRLVSSTSPSGVTTTHDYDVLGRQVGVTDPRTGRTETVFDPTTGRVALVRDPAGNEVTYGYDEASGRKNKECNALEKCTYFEYSPRGELVRTWGDVPYPVEYTYDDYGRRVEMRTFRDESFEWSSPTWPDGASITGDATRWEFEEATGLLLAKRDAVGEATQYTYEAGGRVRTRTWARRDANGDPVSTTYTHDPATGDLLSATHSDETPDATFTYDRLGRRQSVHDGVGERTFAYNPQTLELETETITGLTPAVLTQSYDKTGVVGRPAGFSVGSGYSVSYGYDPATGRFDGLNWTINGQQDSVSYSYLPSSDLIAGLTTASGQQTTYAYEPHRDLKTQVQNRFDAAVVSQYDYGYDAVGRRVNVQNSGSAFAEPAFTKWGYDDRNQLIESRRYLGTDLSDESRPVPAEYRAYSYDPIGNRLSSTAASDETSYSTNSLNQYTEVDGATSGYDEDGNLTNDGEKEYSYNAENQLVAVVPVVPVFGDKRVMFAYDYVGRRVKKSVETYSGAWEPEYETTWVYSAWNAVTETRTDAGASATKEYVWGLDLSQSVEGAGGIGGLVAVVEHVGPVLLFGYDANGNVSELLGPDGSLAAHYTYDSFANVGAAAGPAAARTGHAFSTKYTDGETGLVSYGYRYYSPVAGRWQSRDPIGSSGGLNLYVAASNDLVGRSDPLGLVAGWLAERLLDSFATPDDPGRPFAKELILHYALGFGIPFRRQDGAWGDFMRSLPDLRAMASEELSSVVQDLWAKKLRRGPIRRTVSSVTLHSPKSMWVTLYQGRVEIEGTYTSTRMGHACGVDLDLTFGWIDRGDLHPGKRTKTLNDEWIDDRRFIGIETLATQSPVVGLLLRESMGPYDIDIRWSAASQWKLERGKAKIVTGWPIGETQWLL